MLRNILSHKTATILFFMYTYFVYNLYFKKRLTHSQLIFLIFQTLRCRNLINFKTISKQESKHIDSNSFWCFFKMLFMVQWIGLQNIRNLHVKNSSTRSETHNSRIVIEIFSLFLSLDFLFFIVEIPDKISLGRTNL